MFNSQRAKNGPSGCSPRKKLPAGPVSWSKGLIQAGNNQAGKTAGSSCSPKPRQSVFKTDPGHCCYIALKKFSQQIFFYIHRDSDELVNGYF
jgi:hypothetical protein